jgi:hypothetical protein
MIDPGTWTPPPRTESCLETALWALDVGLWPILISPIDDKRFDEDNRGKAPLGGKGWGKERHDAQWFEASFRRNKGANVGLLLGPDGGIADLDVDEPDLAAPVLERMFEGETPEGFGWKNPGKGKKFHRAFLWDDRLIPYVGKTGVIKGGPHYPGLELRLGGAGKQIQSVIPPSMLRNGRRRRWNDNLAILPLPESFFADLERYGANEEPKRAHATPKLGFPTMTVPPRKRGLRAYGSNSPVPYALGALEREVAKVAAAPKSTRNDTLNVAAFNLGTLIGAGALERSAVEVSLAAAAESVGLGERETAATIASGIDKGMLKPRDLSGIGGGHHHRNGKPTGAKPSADGNGDDETHVDVEAGEDGGFYRIHEGRLWVRDEPLTNFYARITEQVVRDDGDGQSVRFRIEGANCDGTALATDVSAEEFEAMSWVVSKLGARAIINAGRGRRDHTRAAIQELSTAIVRRVVHTHTGWTQTAAGWRYLHSGGAIGPEGLDTTISVDLSEHGLNLFELPAPPEGEGLRRAVRASLGLLDFGKANRPRSKAVAAITLALPYRAAIGPTNYSAQFNGPTGAHKSCMAGLAQQPFGRHMHYNALPAGWNSTTNALQGVRHAIKDALLVIDDFAPGGSPRERERADKAAEEVFRSQGNRQGRRRMGPDGKLRPTMDPRGSLLSTGEDRPSRASANLRTLGVWFDKEDPARGAVGTIDRDVLTRCQADAGAGLYAASMAGFVRWLAPRYEEARDALPAKALSFRKEATREGDHGRTPDIVADLAAGFDVFLEFALATGAITQPEADSHRGAVWGGLMEAAGEMRADQRDAGDSAALFVQLISAALSSNQAFLVDSKTGGDPDEHESACGWRKVLKWQGNDMGQVPMWETGPNALRIGWTDGELVYLDPDLSYNAAQRIIRDRGETLPAPATLRHLLNAGKWLARTDSRNGTEGRGRLTARVSLEKQQHNVLVFNASAVWGEEEAETPDPAREDKPCF